ncbi:MAG: SEL1-like repeat protein [Alphaproteobacteria bacterium]
MSNLGYLFEHALGMETDIEEAHSWYKKSRNVT